MKQATHDPEKEIEITRKQKQDHEKKFTDDQVKKVETKTVQVAKDKRKTLQITTYKNGIKKQQLLAVEKAFSSKEGKRGGWRVVAGRLPL